METSPLLADFSRGSQQVVTTIQVVGLHSGEPSDMADKLAAAGKFETGWWQNNRKFTTGKPFEALPKGHACLALCF